MSYDFLSPVDMHLLDTREFIPELLAVDPSGGGLVEGRFWWNTASHLPKMYDGTAVRVLYTDAVRLNQITAPNGSVDLNSQKITGLALPTLSTDAATKGYVDAVQQGLDTKKSVRVATTANITLSNTQTIDSIALNAGDRVLVKDQTTASENGIYDVVSGGAWVRSADAFTNTGAIPQVTSGMYTFVEEGTANANYGYQLITDGTIVVGTTGLSFTTFSAAGAFTADESTLHLAAGVFSIKTTYPGQASIITVSSTTGITTGVWNATAIAVIHGGTGSTDAASARTALSAAGRYAQDLTTSSTSYNIDHNLNTKDVVVCVRNISTGAEIGVENAATSVSRVVLTFAVAPGANVYRVTVLGQP